MMMLGTTQNMLASGSLILCPRSMDTWLMGPFLAPFQTLSMSLLWGSRERTLGQETPERDSGGLFWAHVSDKRPVVQAVYAFPFPVPRSAWGVSFG